MIARILGAAQNGKNSLKYYAKRYDRTKCQTFSRKAESAKNVF